ncbi:lysozyme inhibitor LprI family protein [Pseudomonas monsensis]
MSVLIIGEASHAASFDCERASAADEKAICANRALNDMDVSMALLYKLDRRFLPMGGRDALIGQQRAWRKKRSQCAADVKCLTDIYQQRIQVLQQIIDTRVVTQGPF